jgi:hypothetical protein
MALVALLAHSQQTRRRQVGQLTLYRARTRLCQCNQLVGVVAAVWRAEQNRQHPLPHLGKQGIGGAGNGLAGGGRQ